jgi:hypothetical protein
MGERLRKLAARNELSPPQCGEKEMLARLFIKKITSEDLKAFHTEFTEHLISGIERDC